MTTPELIEYIKKQKEKNVSKIETTTKLSAMGWHEEDINEGFSKVETEKVIVVPKEIKIDPYREPTIDVVKPYIPPVVIPKIIEPAKIPEVLPVKEPVSPIQGGEIKEIPKQDFIPTLKPKETVGTTFTPIIPSVVPQSIPIINIPTPSVPKVGTPYVGQYNVMPSKVPEVKKTGGVPKIAIWILVVLVIGAISGGTIFAVNQGLIKLPNISINLPFDIPFLKPSPERALNKALVNFSKIKTAHYVGEMNTTFSSNINGQADSNNFEGSFKIKEDGDFDASLVDNFKMDTNLSAEANILTGVTFNLKTELKVLDNTLYIQVPNLGELNNLINLTAGDWYSFNQNDVSGLENVEPSVSTYANYVPSKEVLQSILNVIKNTNFVENLKEVGVENVGDISTYHYQFSINKSAVKDFISKVVDIIADKDLSANKEEALKQIDGIKNMDVDIWVGKKDYMPYKVLLSSSNETSIDIPALKNMNLSVLGKPVSTNETGNNTMVTKTNMTLSMILSKINEKVSITVPANAKSIVNGFKNTELNQKDSILKDSMKAISTEAEIYKSKFKSYGKANAGSCTNPVVGSLFYASATNKNSQPINDIIKLILGTTNNQGTCFSDTKAWAVSFPMFSAKTMYYCIDSEGGPVIPTEIPLTKTVCEVPNP